MMRRFAICVALLVAGMGLAGLALSVIASSEDAPLQPALATPVAPPASLAGSSACCDPAAEPGVGGNPLCFEGHTCCSNGQWSCNNADGSPGCTACGTACGGRNAACTSGANCCSGVCKPNGRCK